MAVCVEEGRKGGAYSEEGSLECVDSHVARIEGRETGGGGGRVAGEWG